MGSKNYIFVAVALMFITFGWAQKLERVNEEGAPPRPLHYRPDGAGAVCVNGTHKFNRALYGSHTGFRLECSDMPEFGLYLPRMGGNLSILVPEFKNCTARYEAGVMEYDLDKLLKITAQVGRSGDDMAMWRIENSGSQGAELKMRFGAVGDVGFSRGGDLGVDKPDCFDFKEVYCKGNKYRVEGLNVYIEYGAKERKELRMVLPPSAQVEVEGSQEAPYITFTFAVEVGEVAYMAIYPDTNRSDMSYGALAQRFEECEQRRAELAGTLKITTPDEWLNPVAGALALAADGIWSGEAWLHGAIGWRTPYSGWRGAYVGDCLGWHERARVHFNTYANNQITDIEPIYDHPRQDSTLNLARAEKRWGTQMYSNGYITRRPRKKDEMSHYDMNLCYIDELIRHLNWTGDVEYAREIFPVIDRHLKWEKRNFDPDGDHLYDAYCCIWASDALYYSGGAVTHSSAYNYYANKKAAEIAEKIGIDPTPYRKEAEAIREAINSTLWCADKGYWAEYKELMGGQRLHKNPALWTFYHTIDSEVGTPEQNYEALSYLSSPYFPKVAVESPDNLGGEYALKPTTNWKPYAWSINNVAIAEVMHTALAYWQSGRAEEAYQLMKAVMMDNMYLGASPLNFGQISYLDPARGECYRDFGDPIGVWSRALVEGLYGIRPDAMNGRLLIQPGFPQTWHEAEIDMRDVAYSYKQIVENDKFIDTYTIFQRFNRQQNTTLRVWRPKAILASDTNSSDVVNFALKTKVNGVEVQWRNSDIEDYIEIDLGVAESYEVVVSGSKVKIGVIPFKDVEQLDRKSVV